MTEIRKVTKEEWIDALFHGGYRQGRGSLRPKAENGGGLCCLGVLASIAWDQWDEGDYGVSTSLPYPFCKAIGMEWLDQAAQDVLIVMNDQEGKTFREIGEYLKELPH